LALYPLVIYKGKTVQQQWFPLDLGPYDGWEFTATENGWTTDETAVDLIRPNCWSQMGMGATQRQSLCGNAFINNVHLLFLPPHTSHVLQPRDLSVFSPVKSAYRKTLQPNLNQWNDSTIVGKRHFLACYQQASLSGLIESNILSGWMGTGLWPVNISKPLMNPLLLPKAAAPTIPLNKAAQGIQGIQGIQDAHGIEGWASASSKSELASYRVLFVKIIGRNRKKTSLTIGL
ncbi:transposase, partial [Colletotrichum incanum]